MRFQQPVLLPARLGEVVRVVVRADHDGLRANGTWIVALQVTSAGEFQRASGSRAKSHGPFNDCQLPRSNWGRGYAKLLFILTSVVSRATTKRALIPMTQFPKNSPEATIVPS